MQAIGSLAIAAALSLALAGCRCRVTLPSTRAHGERLFVERGCIGCHTAGAIGTPIATDLTHVGRQLDRATLARRIRDPATLDEPAHMPRLGLSEPDVQALAAYLASLR